MYYVWSTKPQQLNNSMTPTPETTITTTLLVVPNTTFAHDTTDQLLVTKRTALEISLGIFHFPRVFIFAIGILSF